MAAGLVVALAVVAQAAPASAQCGPYGCPPAPPEAAPFPEGTCVLSITSAEPGASVQAEVRNVPVGTTVELRVNGEPVGSQTATTPRQGSDPPVSDLTFTFAAPAAPGAYEVVAVGPAFQAVCTSELAVLGTQATNQPRSESSRGSLARTGVAIGLLVALGIALIVVGRAVHARADRRRGAPVGLAREIRRREAERERIRVGR